MTEAGAGAADAGAGAATTVAVTASGAAIGYEQARDELIDVVRRLEAGGTTLEESLALWERGEELAKVCRHWLEGARARLDASLAQERESSDQEG
ncbi:exodeoxyribonuclease VII small subunit [Streptomyces thermolilacinus SPC6]|uniref:Exodeoxyribonuclease 7 small subunit n=1 Tax=Streptomyces thermolilacinus SPC6 TaxID=1306406 RepID=A0A1D3E052_9ACTN|nr:exodeoxyribonuclease VII small subunit [Streptomyces thermolilacinus SPC6]